MILRKNKFCRVQLSDRAGVPTPVRKRGRAEPSCETSLSLASAKVSLQREKEVSPPSKPVPCFLREEIKGDVREQ